MIHTLVDVVSKNGNLLLNVPVRGDGTIDTDELTVVEEIGEWMKINSEAIYGISPWKVFGEGPAKDSAAPLSAQSFNEGKGKPFESKDVRPTDKGDDLYATIFGWLEDGKVSIKSLAKGNSLHTKGIKKLKLLRRGKISDFDQTTEGLTIKVPGTKSKLSYTLVFKIS